MSVLRCKIRRGTYLDSVVLMQLQSDLKRLEGITAAGVVMGTATNLELLRSSELLPSEAAEAGAEDLVVVVRAASEQAATEALAAIDELLGRRGDSAPQQSRCRSLAAALKLLPEATWVLVSTPGRFAAGVAGEALERDCSVFLYSDNVPLEAEVELKRKAADAGLLVLGPDCGTAIVNGVGLGFANRVRRGAIGVVAASGTGLQVITSRLHQRGAGVSQAIGTGGRDLHAEVGGATAHQALDLLGRDPQTEVIVIASKPPAPAVATALLARALRLGKPVVVHLSGWAPPAAHLGTIAFARCLEEAADLAVDRLAETRQADSAARTGEDPGGSPGFLRGLFAGGTLALEALQGLRAFLAPIYSNLPGAEGIALADASLSRGHTILDLGADELTVGRLHPMLDQQLRLERLGREAADPEVALILLDVVTGSGAHPDPASELAPAIAAARQGRALEIVVLLVGTDEDPQDLAATSERLIEAGAVVFRSTTQAVTYAALRLAPMSPPRAGAIPPDRFERPVAAINVGLELFFHELVRQGVPAVQVDWRPPAGGNERLAAILEKMKK